MIEIVDAVSAPGSGTNEDAWGHARYHASAAAWVLDGATGLAGRDYVPEGPSDAAWLARTLSSHLAAVSSEDDIVGLFADALRRVRADYIGQVPTHGDLPSYALPSAAGMWLRLFGRVLDLAWMGDCVAVVAAGEALHVVGAAEAEADSRAVAALIAERLGTERVGAAMLTRLGTELRARRAGLNRPGGYWMFAVEPAAVAGLQRLTLSIDGPATALLCSDGFWRLVDHFAVYTAAGLIAAAQHQGLAPLMRQLRALEQADPEGRRVPRVKPHDDATAILCKLSPAGLKS